MTWCHCVFLHTLDSGPCVLKMLGSSVLSIILPGSRSLWPPLSDRCVFAPCRSADIRSLVFPMMLYSQPSLQKQTNQQYKLRWVNFTDGVTNKNVTANSDTQIHFVSENSFTSTAKWLLSKGCFKMWTMNQQSHVHEFTSSRFKLTFKEASVKVNLW